MFPSSIKSDYITDGTKLIDGVWLQTNTYDVGIFGYCLLYYGGCFQNVMGFQVSPDLLQLHVTYCERKFLRAQEMAQENLT